MTQEIPLPFDVDLLPVEMVNAGSLTCLYETGKLRYIRLGNTELIRMIYPAVRDDNWETIPYQIEDEKLTIGESGFTIRYTAMFGQGVPMYKADYLIEGKADNSIIFSMKGKALAPFQKNRIGLCVLHPVNECRGKGVIVTQPDGTRYQSLFPEAVSPFQPLLQVARMEWTAGQSINAQLSFEGDIFETEDQRNWSDSSYKTYSTPLVIPFPVSIHPGDIMEQKVTLRVWGEVKNNVAEPLKEIREEKLPFPKIGYARSKDRQLLTNADMERLSKIPFDHYRVPVSMNKPGWQEDLQNALAEAGMVNTRLELILFFSDDYTRELALLIQELREKQQLLQSILPLLEGQRVSPAGLLHSIYPILKKEFPAVQVGYGTDFFFADLNRARPGRVPYDFVSFSLNPQVHAADNRSILENLENLPDIIETAMNFAGGKPVFVSPVTIKDRHSHAGHDERQYTWLAAVWTLISIQNLSGANNITFYELFGQSGILPVNQNDQAPVYEVLSTIHLFRPAHVIKRWLGPQLLVDGLLLENEDGERIFFKAPPEAVDFKRYSGH